MKRNTQRGAPPADPPEQPEPGQPARYMTGVVGDYMRKDLHSVRRRKRKQKGGQQP